MDWKHWQSCTRYHTLCWCGGEGSRSYYPSIQNWRSHSMLSFLAAFSISTFEDADLLVYVIIGVFWFAVASLISWCIYISWEGGFRPVMWVTDRWRQVMGPLLSPFIHEPSEADNSGSPPGTKSKGSSWHFLWVWNRRSSLASSATAVWRWR